MEFVNFLKHPDKYLELGAKIPKVMTDFIIIIIIIIIIILSQ